MTGFIDRQLINSFDTKDVNYNNLRTLVNSDYVVNVVLDDKYLYISPNGRISVSKMNYYPFDDNSIGKDIQGETINGLTTGEYGVMGKTLFPDMDGLQNSINNNINVVVNKNLSIEGAAQVYSHEGNGHALLYVLNGGNHQGASHQSLYGWKDLNSQLVRMIIESKKDTIKNMGNR